MAVQSAEVIFAPPFPGRQSTRPGSDCAWSLLAIFRRWPAIVVVEEQQIAPVMQAIKRAGRHRIQYGIAPGS